MSASSSQYVLYSIIWILILTGLGATVGAMVRRRR
jgi:hypothetical protein